MRLTGQAAKATGGARPERARTSELPITPVPSQIANAIRESARPAESRTQCALRRIVLSGELWPILGDG